MPAYTLTAPALTLGGFLRDRRERLAPEPGAQGRRRTPGLRREEVATRAGVSVTWYTWLEQERGGPPSSEVLERLARALELDDSGREALFLLAQQRPPPLRSAPIPAVTPALQRVLDGFATSAAIVKTPTWDVVAWNAAAVAVLGDYSRLPARECNVLRRLFDPENPRRAHVDWEHDARFAIAVFRMDVARAGDSTAAAALATEMQASSADFRRLWAENGISNHWVGRKRFENPLVGAFSLETSAFAVEGADGLSMIVFSPVAAADLRAVELLLAEHARSAAPSLKATA